MTYSLPYLEPSIQTVLVLSSFVLLLNSSRYVFHRFLRAGLVGELLVGMIFGAPLGNILDAPVQLTVQQLGYLGLILIVYEGGLTTSIPHLRSNLPLSLTVALTGILLPIAFSFLLIPLTQGQTTAKAAFASGASLCSTSLGTTFSILQSVGLSESRLGSVLVAAAMMDDVVGLIMVKVITGLGTGPVSGIAIARPVIASSGLLLCAVLVGMLGVLVIRAICCSSLRGVQCLSEFAHLPFLVHTGTLVMLVGGASYAGASPLFASFLSGALSSHIHPASARHVFQTYYSSLVRSILAPFFFASIGFAIPFRSLWTGRILWLGIVYSVFQVLAKAATGICIVQRTFWRRKGRVVPKSGENTLDQPTFASNSRASLNLEVTQTNDPSVPDEIRLSAATHHELHSDSPCTQAARFAYPALILALAMISRGEVGFLIASLSESHGIFKPDDWSNGGSPVFLVTIWALIICTLVGPLDLA